MPEITKEEAIAELQRRQEARRHTAEPNQSILGSLWGSQKGYLKGLSKGAIQGAGDIGASAANVPADLIETLSGKRPYTVPHPHLIDEEPKGFGETIGQTLGQNIPRIALEVALTRRFAPLGGRGALGRIGAGTLGGAATGAAVNEDRLKGATEGALSGAVGGALTEFPLFQRQAGRHYQAAENMINQHNIGGFHLTPEMRERSTEYLSLPGLAPQRLALQRLMQETEGGTYNAAHQLQSNLGHVARELSKGQGADRLLGQEIARLRRDINNMIRGNVSEQGYEDIAQRLIRAQDLYRRHNQIKPYVKKGLHIAAGGGLLGGAAAVPYKLITAGGR